MIRVPGRETVLDLLLQGTRFAILHGDGPKPNLSVYEMKDVRSAVKAVQPVVHNPSRAANVIHWSPTGKNMVLAGLKVGRLNASTTLLAIRHLRDRSPPAPA